MLFYVIYEFDVSGDSSVKHFNPPFKAKGFTLTECHETEYEDCFTREDRRGRTRKGKHRKYAGILTREQWDKLYNASGLMAEEVETMGSLTDIGLLPAISFRGSDGYDSMVGAYVTPLIERKGGCDERDWERVRSAMISVYS
jgi:hypothetical protein